MLPHTCHKELSEYLGYPEDVWYSTLQKMCDIMQMGMQVSCVVFIKSYLITSFII